MPPPFVQISFFLLSFIMLSDSPEYVHRTKTAFVPPELDYAVLRKALPDEVWKRSTSKALIAFTRLVIISAALHAFGVWLVRGAPIPEDFPYAPEEFSHTALKVAGWAFYLWWQPITWAGFWALGKWSTRYSALPSHSDGDHFLRPRCKF